MPKGTKNSWETFCINFFGVQRQFDPSIKLISTNMPNFKYLAQFEQTGCFWHYQPKLWVKIMVKTYEAIRLIGQIDVKEFFDVIKPSVIIFE